MRKFPYRFFARYFANLVRARYQSGPNKKMVPPMIASLYLTTKCNFRCTYCDDGSGNMYPDIHDDPLNTEKTIKVLEILRRASPGLSVTGGEPTLRSDLGTLFENINRLAFRPVSLNTNGFLVDRLLPVLPNLDYLIISLDSVDEGRSDELINLSTNGQTKRVMNNIEFLENYRKEHGLKFNIIINTVIFPETIDDAWGVFQFCLEHDFHWTPMPYIVGKYPSPGLIDNKRWHELIDEAIRLKKAGARVYGNMEVIRTIRDFKRFECYPSLRPTVYPSGEIYYPCSPLNSLAGNLLEIGDYDKAMELGEKKFGSVPYCDSRCHLACYAEGSTAITHPEEVMSEAFRAITHRRKQWTLRRPAVQNAEMPPSFEELRKLPSLPPDKVRALRREGMLLNDWTSRIRIKGSQNLEMLVPITGLAVSKAAATA
ncbi:MAG TPA: radical SAM protein [Pyrinomonadaceae bacterium]|nr:radical SAM protein [Pyrinomonadaceae bacterium]